MLYNYSINDDPKVENDVAKIIDIQVQGYKCLSDFHKLTSVAHWYEKPKWFLIFANQINYHNTPKLHQYAHYADAYILSRMFIVCSWQIWRQ